MKILITGGTGFIGQELIRQRLAAGDEVICLSRQPERVQNLFGTKVRGISELPPAGSEQVDAVVNLAGAGIVDQRWSESRKALLRSSRIELTRQLVDWIGQQPVKPEVLVSGSAIGFYGSQGDQPINEQGPVTDGFTHQLCADWEAEALRAEALGVRVCLLRTGVVLGRNGGALAKMLLPFKLGLGGPVASGKQWMSWIHLDDEVDAIGMLLTHPQLSGAFNLTSPNAVTNREFSKTLGQLLKRPACLPMPGFMLQLMLGEGAELLTEGQRVYPERLLELGFKFKYPELDQAMRAAV